uniref:Uncharacterized protein n=1 Tax=Rhizophora mucronata TaxID=61149 RepID=A0A2P2M3Y8_RHIMU
MWLQTCSGSNTLLLVREVN